MAVPPAQLPDPSAAERAVLGALLLEPRVCDDVLALVGPDDFAGETRALLCRSIVALHARRDAIDPVTVQAYLREIRAPLGSQPELLVQLTDLLEQCPSAANAEYYAGLVHEHAVARRVAAYARTILAEATQGGQYRGPEWYQSLERRLCALTEERVEHLPRPLAETVPESVRRTEQRVDAGSCLLGLSTGFLPLDRLTSGLQPSRLYVLAARPGVGKSSIALQVADAVASADKGAVVMFSLEMSEAELTDRLLAQRGELDGLRLANGVATDDELKRLIETAVNTMKLPIFLDESSFATVGDMRRKTRRINRDRGPVALIIVDYLQLMVPHARHESREREIADVSRALKALAKELGVPVLAVAQLNRQPEARVDKRPALGDLRESGAIEQDSDVVWFLWPGPSNESWRVNSALAKNRHGPTGRWSFAFDRATTRFSVTPDDEEPAWKSRAGGDD